MNMPPIVSPQEWEAGRQKLLVVEKKLTRARDALAAKRRRMLRMAVEKNYRFRAPGRPMSLDGRHDDVDAREPGPLAATLAHSARLRCCRSLGGTR
jgi:predicted dithiol-disulfide oxidoreductase (DUF899 family)